MANRRISQRRARARITSAPDLLTCPLGIANLPWSVACQDWLHNVEFVNNEIE